MDRVERERERLAIGTEVASFPGYTTWSGSEAGTEAAVFSSSAVVQVVLASGWCLDD